MMAQTVCRSVMLLRRFETGIESYLIEGHGVAQRPSFLATLHSQPWRGNWNREWRQVRSCGRFDVFRSSMESFRQTSSQKKSLQGWFSTTRITRRRPCPEPSGVANLARLVMKRLFVIFLLATASIWADDSNPEETLGMKNGRFWSHLESVKYGSVFLVGLIDGWKL